MSSPIVSGNLSSYIDKYFSREISSKLRSNSLSLNSDFSRNFKSLLPVEE